MKKMRNFFVPVVLLAFMFVLAGCGDKNTNSSVTNPNPNAFTPKGTVSGLLRDAVTNQALVGAKVSILDKSATTNDSGLFTISDVPALNGAGNEPTNSNSEYPVVIDMTSINKTISTYNADASNMVKKALYPSTAYTKVTVTYSSLGETSQAVGNTNATNHDTPIDGFVANIIPFVGKLDANIKMQVVDTSLSPVAVASVYLYQASTSASSQNNTTTGATQDSTPVAPGHLVQGPLTTDGLGFVTFASVEAKQQYVVKATTVDGREGWYSAAALPLSIGVNQQVAAVSVTAPADGQTDVYAVQGGTSFASDGGSAYNTALVITTNDNVAPFVLSVSPTNLADIAVPGSGNLAVVFTFSEPISSTNYANAVNRDLAVNGGIYNDVIVSYNGPKAGNINHTIAWTDSTHLTVSIPAASLAAASRYSVSILKAIDGPVGRRLTDVNLNNFVLTTNSSTSFTTSGTFNVAAPVLAKTNGGTNSVAIEWASVSNAASYKVYIAKSNLAPYAVLGTAANASTVVAVSAYPTFSLATLPDFSLANNVVYTVKVTAVNGNNSESSFSNELSFSENAPAAPSAATRTVLAADVTSYQYTWPNVSNAVKYNVYVEPVVGGIGQGFAAPVSTTVPSVDLTATVAAVTLSKGYTSNFNLAQQNITWNVKITSVGLYGSESPATATSTVINDQARPEITAVNAATVTTGVLIRPVVGIVTGTIAGVATTGSGTLTINFSNVMNYSDLSTWSNYSISAPSGSKGTSFSITSVTPNANGQSAVIGYSYSIATVAFATPANTMLTGNALLSFFGKSVSGLTIRSNGL